MNQVFADNLLDILQLDEAIPNRLGVDDDHRSVLALVETAGLVGPYLVLQTSVFQGILESCFQLFTAIPGTTWAGGALVALVPADE